MESAPRAGNRAAGRFRRAARVMALPGMLVLVALLATAAGARTGEFRVEAKSAGALDLETGAWIFEQAIDETLSVASLSKIAAALTFVENVENLDALVTIRHEDWTHAGRTKLRIGDRVSGRTLLRLALVASDNCAARALTHPLGLDWESYGLKMTLLARRLGCRSTIFVEPTGRDSRNISTVRDMSLLFRAAIADPLLRDILGTSEFVLETARGERPVGHSSSMVRYRTDIFAAKTGYTDAAGYCLVEGVSDSGGDFVTLVLGTSSKRRRVTESSRIIDHVRALRRGGF